MVPFLLYAKKDLKKLLAYSISPRWVNCRDLYLTIDGLRGVVLQMIAHLFCSSFFRRYETNYEMGGINITNLLRCSYF
jgi:NADH:ubiquinone oxidoreductase subunit 4 (subunit M)